MTRMGIPRIEASKGDFTLLILVKRILVLERFGSLGALAFLGHGPVTVCGWGKHSHVPGNDVIRFALVALPVPPLSGADASFEIHELPFGQILTGNFRELVPGNDYVEYRPEHPRSF